MNGLISKATEITHHGQGKGVDVVDVQETVLPGDEALHVDVELVPDGQDGLVVLLVPSDTIKNFDYGTNILCQELAVLEILSAPSLLLLSEQTALTCWRG